MTRLLSIHTVRFVVLLLLQVLILSHINFLGYINPYVYILFVLLYPIKNNRLVFIFLSFLLGLFVDLFLDSGGIHAAASVTIAFIRPAVLKFCFGSEYEHQTVKFNATNIGLRLTYISIITLIHHLILFSLDIFNLSRAILILKNTLFCGIFTIFLCVLITLIFSKPSQ